MSLLFEKIFQKEEIKNLITPQDRILVALSGGPDSVFLLYFLLYLKERLDIEIVAAHLNHMIREKEAERDLLFCKSLTEKLGVPFVSGIINVKDYAIQNKLSLEEAARTKRYAFLVETAKKYNLKKIALAHTLDDLIETFFIRLLRGSGIFGLKAMPLKRYEKNILIIRPLLYLSKEVILNYLNKNRIYYVIDSTNFSTKYLRNYIRHNILPQFTNLNPSFFQNILTLTSQIDQLEKYLNPKIKNALQSILLYSTNKLIKLDLHKFSQLPEFLKGAVLREGIKSLRGTTRGIYSVHIDNILSIINSPGEKDYSLPYNIKVKKTYDYLFLYREIPFLFRKISHFSYKLELQKDIFLEDIGIEISAFPSRKFEDLKFFDIIYKIPYNIFREGIFLRNRREGDRFKGKKLKKIFIDKKIPYYLRDKIPLISSKDKIFAIIGIKDYNWEKLDEYVIIGVKFERGGTLWNELWKRFLSQKKESKKESKN